MNISHSTEVPEKYWQPWDREYGMKYEEVQMEVIRMYNKLLQANNYKDAEHWKAKFKRYFQPKRI